MQQTFLLPQSEKLVELSGRLQLQANDLALDSKKFLLCFQLLGPNFLLLLGQPIHYQKPTTKKVTQTPN
jgi:hypothetical protein